MSETTSDSNLNKPSRHASGKGSPKTVLKVIWTVMGLAVFIYGYVVYDLAHKSLTADVDIEPIKKLQMIFGVFALVTAGLIGVVKKKMMKEHFEKAMTREKITVEAMVKMFPGYVVSWAMCETVALWGVVLGILARDFQFFIPFGAASLLLMYHHRPPLSSAAQ